MSHPSPSIVTSMAALSVGSGAGADSSAGGLRSFAAVVDAVAGTFSHLGTDGSAIQVKDDIEKILNDFDPTIAEVRRFAHFDSHRYVRHLLFQTEDFSVFLNCWKPLQSAPKHSHGLDITNTADSFMWIRMIEGSLTMESQMDTDRRAENVLSAKGNGSGVSSMCFPDHELGLHHLRNDSSDQRAISLHIYSPPLVNCTFGPDNVNPAVFCPALEVNSVGSYCPSKFSNFETLAEMLRREIKPMIPVTQIKDHPDLHFAKPYDRTSMQCVHSDEHIQHVITILSELLINKKEWNQYVSFAKGHYTRNLVGTGNHFTAVLLCWNHGQMSPIHDHAGSSCWVKVLQGELREDTFDHYDDGREGIYLASSRTFSEGGVTYINDAVGLHRMGNPNPDTVCMSLHVYSPAIRMCNCYANDLSGSKKLVSLAAANMPLNPFTTNAPESPSSPASTSPDAPPTPGRDEAVDRTLASPSAPIGLASIFSSATERSVLSLQEFTVKIQEEFIGDISKESRNRISSLLDRVVLSAEEWHNYVHFDQNRYTRNLVSISDKYSLMIDGWLPGQGTSIHDHGPGHECWTKVLVGTLKIAKYRRVQSENAEKHLTVVSEGESDASVRYSDSSLGLHKVWNPSTNPPSVSIHLFYPPYVECCGFSDDCKQTKSSPIVYCPATIICENAEAASGSQIITPSRASRSTNTMMLNVENRRSRVSPMSSPQASPQTSPRTSPQRSPRESAVETTPGSLYTMCLQLKTRREVFTNFRAVSAFLRYFFDRECSHRKDGDRIIVRNPVSLCDALRRFQINPVEWKQYVNFDPQHYSRSLVACDDSFSMHLLCFDAGQGSLIHDHGSSQAWVKVLEGELTETTYVPADANVINVDDSDGSASVTSSTASVASSFSSSSHHHGPVSVDEPHSPGSTNLEVDGQTLLTADSVVYIRRKLAHRVENCSSAPAFCLYIYSPPLSCCSCYDSSTGTRVFRDVSSTSFFDENTVVAAQ